MTIPLRATIRHMWKLLSLSLSRRCVGHHAPWNYPESCVPRFGRSSKFILDPHCPIPCHHCSMFKPDASNGVLRCLTATHCDSDICCMCLICIYIVPLRILNSVQQLHHYILNLKNSQNFKCASLYISTFMWMIIWTQFSKFSFGPHILQLNSTATLSLWPTRYWRWCAFGCGQGGRSHVGHFAWSLLLDYCVFQWVCVHWTACLQLAKADLNGLVCHP